MDGETCRVEAPRGPANFRSTSVKHYYVEGRRDELNEPVQPTGPDTPEELDDSMDTIKAIEQQDTAPAERGCGRPRQYPLPEARESEIYISEREIKAQTLAKKLEAEGKLRDDEFLFRASRAKEIHGLQDRGVFQVATLWTYKAESSRLDSWTRSNTMTKTDPTRSRAS